MTRGFRVAAAALILCGILAAGTVMAADKVGYINLQRLVNESDMGKEARQDILKLRREREAAVADQLKEINELRSVINTRDAEMGPEEKRQKLEALQKAYKEYQRMVADAREDITREDRQLVAIILEKADGVLKTVAKRKKYTIILKDPNAIGYLDPKVDITDDVLAELNKKK